jgi:phage gp45-like
MSLAGLVRLIDKRIASIKATFETMIELAEASGISGSAGAVPTCTVDDDDADVFEPYGLAGQAASGDAVVLAPGGDTDTLTALVSSVAGRPATEPGDKALWTAGGHVIYLDDDADLTVTGKDGGTVVIKATSGAINIDAATGANVTITVGPGASVNVGGVGALPLTIWGPLSVAMTAMFVAGKAVPVGGAAFLAAESAWNAALLLLSPEAQKAKGL